MRLCSPPSISPSRPTPNSPPCIRQKPTRSGANPFPSLPTTHRLLPWSYGTKSNFEVTFERLTSSRISTWDLRRRKLQGLCHTKEGRTSHEQEKRLVCPAGARRHPAGCLQPRVMLGWVSLSRDGWIRRVEWDYQSAGRSLRRTGAGSGPPRTTTKTAPFTSPCRRARKNRDLKFQIDKLRFAPRTICNRHSAICNLKSYRGSSPCSSYPCRPMHSGVSGSALFTIWLTG